MIDFAGHSLSYKKCYNTAFLECVKKALIKKVSFTPEVNTSLNSHTYSQNKYKFVKIDTSLLK